MKETKVYRLDWDSNFFGYEIGKITLSSSNFNEKELVNRTNEYDLVYLESDTPLEKNKYGECFTKIKFVREIDLNTTDKPLVKDNSVTQYSGNLTSELLNLAYKSGEFSRFKLDKNFKNNEFKKLYKKWIENCLTGISADSVMIIKNDKSNILAFATLKFIKNKSEIGLIAVNQSSRGIGLGTLLIDSAIHLSSINKCKRIFVSTQLENKKACSFYEKNGFQKYEIKYIYHWWRN